MLNLGDIAKHDRFELEDLCRSAAQSAYLGGHTAVCRMLARYKFYVDTRDQGFGSNMLLDGFWEMWLTQFMARTVTPGMVVADIGANYGYYSVLLADLVGPEGRLYAFEPNPVAVTSLTQTLALNGFMDRTQIVPAGLGAEDGELTLYVPENEPKNASFVSAVGRCTEHRVPVHSLDRLLAEAPRLDFVKIDAEGAEQMILSGMTQTIARLRPAMVLEFNAVRYADAAGFLATLLGHYGNLGEIDYFGNCQPVSETSVLTERMGEDRLLFFRGS